MVLDMNPTVLDMDPKMNIITTRCLQANETCETYFHAHQQNYKKIINLVKEFVRYNNSIPSNQNVLLQHK